MNINLIIALGCREEYTNDSSVRFGVRLLTSNSLNERLH